MDELEKIDVIRERLGVTYKEAKEALDRAGGDVVQALINLEDAHRKWDDALEEKGRQLIEYIKEIIRKGNVTRVKLKKGDHVVIEIPATVGAIGIGGIFLSPILAILSVVGTVAALVANYSLEIERQDGQVEKRDLSFLEEENKQDPGAES